MKYQEEINKIWSSYLNSLTEDERKQAIFKMRMDDAAIIGIIGILFALIGVHKPLLMDLSNCDIRDPFNLQKGWLLWAIIGVIVANTATFGTTFATKYFSKRWPQPKTKDSIDTRHERHQVTVSLKTSILIWLVMVALLLPPLVEEYVYSGYPMASLTRSLATTTVVVISSFIIAFAHWNSDELSHLFVGALAFGLTYAKTQNLTTSVAMHLLLIMVRCSVTFITFIRQTFSPGIVLLHRV